MVDTCELLDAVNLAKNHYFKKIMNKHGKFIYEFHPSRPKKPSRYNMLRHAGTVYAMLETFELTNDPAILTAAHQGLKFLIKKIEPFSVKGNESLVSGSIMTASNWGNGLSLIAFAKFCEVSGSREYVSLMQHLAEFIVQTQRDDGWFPVHKIIKSRRQVTDFVSGYYPGEAILGLARLYRIDPNEQWLHAAQKAADYIIHVRDRDKIIPDHWFMYALNDLYKIREKRAYLDHSLKMAKKSAAPKSTIILSGRNGRRVYRDCPAAAVHPAACRSEGLCATCQLVRDHGNPSDRQALDTIKQAIHAGIDFQLQTQVKGDITFSKNGWADSWKAL
ncbi:MAG: glycoside hydrolase family 127 protein [Desulfotignum sp.]|nr:glycoside hydrolase family 127 protein [Desulfotignum sp.]